MLSASLNKTFPSFLIHRRQTLLACTAIINIHVHICLPTRIKSLPTGITSNIAINVKRDVKSIIVLCVSAGSVSQHKARCCDVCGVSNHCTTSSSSVCPCVWHREHNALQPHLVELGIREKALKAKDFPQKQVTVHPVQFGSVRLGFLNVPIEKMHR